MRQYIVKREIVPSPRGGVVLRGHTVFDVPPGKWTPPPDAEGGYYRLAEWEAGGGYTNTGNAQIVCSLNGEPLIPVVIRRRGPLACEQHALFVGQALVMVYAGHHRGDYSFSVVRKEINPKTGDVKEEVLWSASAYIPDFDEWADSNLPEFMSAFRPALKAAWKKADCYHCREIHYMKSD